MEVSMRLRGRPEQILQKNELELFLDFLRNQDSLSQLQETALAYLYQSTNFESFSETERLILKQAFKPFREYLKVDGLVTHLQTLEKHSLFEEKLLALYKEYERTEDPNVLNLLKTMTTRYYRLQDKDGSEQALALFLSEIEKKDKKQKRTAENKRKFELGGAVLAAFKELKMSPQSYTAEQVKESIVNDKRYFQRMRSTQFFFEASQLTRNYNLEDDVIVKALNSLSEYTIDGKSITTIVIEKAILEVKQLESKR